MNPSTVPELFRGMERIALACRAAGHKEIAQEVEHLSASIGQLHSYLLGAYN